MSQFALPLVAADAATASRIVIGTANAQAIAALRDPAAWPFGTAVLTGGPRSGKSLLARWFADSGHGTAVDDAHQWDETDLFHRWNRAQADDERLLLVAGTAPWNIALPDLRSRLGAAMMLEIGTPDALMAEELLLEHFARRGLAPGEGAPRYLVPRMPRSFAGIERLVAEIDRISLERQCPPGQAVWRDALETVVGPDEPRLL